MNYLLADNSQEISSLNGFLNWKQELGDNCIQNFHFGRYIVRYTFGSHVLPLRLRVAVKLNFRPYIQRYTSPSENFEFSYLHSNALLTFSLQKDSENVLFCAYMSSDSSCINRLPAAYIHLSTNEKRRYVMTSSFRQYIAEYTVTNL